MALALEVAATARRRSSPNPWVGAALLPADGSTPILGATEPPGGRHAEIVALEAAGAAARDGLLAVTLEPCCHEGRTGPCVEAIIKAGLATVVVAIEDPDPQVAGRGLHRLREAGVEVIVGPGADLATEQLAPYLVHRRTGRPQVVLKLAMTLDGRTAAADGSSRWITSPAARAEVHELRADADAVLVGAGTVRRDDPALSARTEPPTDRQPLRLVLGEVPEGAAVLPAICLGGPLEEVLDELGRRGVLQLLVEGGASVAHDFLAQDLVDRLVVYVAPALMGGDDGSPLLRGPGAPTIEALRRGRFVRIDRVGDDVRMEMEL
jgi:diaminohydroxyphosphoribosylaminopyrimidine deaminase/5-amino-6-(5-phosphoribosylamino)uracil reductase